MLIIERLKNQKIEKKKIEEENHQIGSNRIITKYKKKVATYSIFLSHHKQERKLANLIKELFEDFNITSFVAHDDIKAGEVWERSIISSVKNSKIILVIGTKNIENSPWVNFEVGLGYEDMLPIIFDKLSDKVSYIKNKQGILVGYENLDNTIINLIKMVMESLGLKLGVKEGTIKTFTSYKNLKEFIDKNYNKEKN